MMTRAIPAGAKSSTAKGAPDDSVIGQAYDARLMKRLLGYLKPYRLPVIGAVILLLVATVVELAGPLVIKYGIDNYISLGKIDGLGMIVLLFGGLLLVGMVLRYYQVYLTSWIGERVVLDLRTKLYDHLQRLDVKTLDSRPIGWWMTRITNDVQTLNEMFSGAVVSVFGDLFALVGIVVVMLWMNWRLAVVTFTVLPLLIWVVTVFRKAVRNQFRIIREAIAKLNGFVQEHISGIRTVQLFSRDKEIVTQFGEYNVEYRSAYIKTIRYYALFFPAVTFLASLATALILLSGGLMIRASMLTWGGLVAFIQYAERFFRPIRDLSERYNTMQAAMAAAERVFWLMDHEIEIGQKPSAVTAPPMNSSVDAPPMNSSVDAPPMNSSVDALSSTATDVPADRRGSAEALTSSVDAPPSTVTVIPADRRGSAEEINGEIVFDSVSFAYKPDSPILRDISFTIEPGKTVAVVGATGAGKTTLISLLLRFWDVTSGRILLDGKDIREYPVGDLRRSFGVVLQDTFLFSGSVASNVGLGDPLRDREVMKQALIEAEAWSFVENLPKGIDEPVGERGAMLSGGEKQLLSIARAIAANPPLLLLDEATAAVDTETEQKIHAAFDRLMTGRTTLVVAHRLSTIRKASKILVMHHGRIVETGSHEELLAMNGLYAKLYRLQFAEAA